MLRGSWSTCRAHPGPVVGLAALMFGGSAAIDTFIDRLAEGLGASRIAEVLAVVLAGPVSITTFGLVLYAGVLDRVVGHHLHGHPKLTVWQAVGTLPWVPLLVADLLLVTATTLGMALFVVPGLVVFTFFCLVGPVVNIEGVGVIAAFRRSATLVRRAPWLTGGLVTTLTLVEVLLIHGLNFATADYPYLAAFAITALIGMTVGAVVGLFEVTLAYELVGGETRRQR